MSDAAPPRLTLLGAPGDVPNLGVRALLRSTAGALLARRPDLLLTVVDSTPPADPTRALDLDGRTATYEVTSARLGLRLWRTDNAATALALQLIGVRLPLVRQVEGADAVLDLTGGDSFTDIYGLKRLLTGAVPKIVTLRARTPLVLLPQTYGEFRRGSSRRVAEAIVRRSTLAFARDARSHDQLVELAGDRYDPRRHRRSAPAVRPRCAAVGRGRSRCPRSRCRRANR